MKKILNLLSSITIISSSILTVTSCGNPISGSSFYNTNYNKAFGIIFSTKAEDKSINFSMLPDLKAIPKPDPGRLKPSTFNYATDKIKKLKLKDNEIKLNCENYVCNQNNSFKGKKLTREEYNTNDEDKIIIQYAIDDLAQWFLIPPDFNEEIFYDFSNLVLNANYQNNIYFFNKNNELETEELILWSKQDYINISNENKKIENSFTFFDKDIRLTTEIIDLILNSKNSKIENIITLPEKNNENKNKRLVINFEDIDKEKETLTKQSVENLFKYYQNNLKFTEKVETEKPESDNSQVVSKKTYKSDNLKSFEIEKAEIKEIVININYKLDVKGESK
ncbi:hypothetical protein [Spiroplasma floricola]|uniref:Lipoprotein n=1 Tax=Spiroplasma floricola 23-6 TaxID=1336749 RepID=A0A2K8SDP2_9MOLU|nr:hypothetical protein [Spiroplasma floricola]AUB31543.1 hypothetical protein SFLOR_v1c04910 [Spiroplasma floricola 23-6]